MIKQILVGVIALSMTLLTACGKTSKLVSTTQVSAPVEVEFEHPTVADSKPWLTDYDWKMLKYGAIGTAVAIAFFAGAMYGSYIGRKAGVIEGKDKQFVIDEPKFKLNRMEGGQEGMHQGWHAGAQAQQAIDDANLQQLQQFASQQYTTGEQNGLNRGLQQGRDAGFQDGVAEGLRRAQTALTATPNFPVVPINETPTFIPNANSSPLASNIPSVPIQSRNAAPQRGNVATVLATNALPKDFVMLGFKAGQKAILEAVDAKKVQYSADEQVSSFNLPIPERTRRMIAADPTASYQKGYQVQHIQINITNQNQSPIHEQYVAPQGDFQPQFPVQGRSSQEEFGQGFNQEMLGQNEISVPFQNSYV